MPKGVVGYVGGKAFQDNKTGEDITLYSFKLDGDDTWYRVGQKNPDSAGVKKGASISFALDSKGKPDLGTVKVLNGGDNAAPQRSPAPRASSTSKDDYWSKKEEKDVAKDARYQEVDIPRMTFAGAQETAVHVVELAIANGALDLGTAKKAAKLDILLEAIDKVAHELFSKRINCPTMSQTKTSKPTSNKDANNVDDEPAEVERDGDDYE